MADGSTIARKPVSRALWHDVMGYAPSVEMSETGDAVQRVSLVEAALFTNRLSDARGLARCYEVACQGARAGAGPHVAGDDALAFLAGESPCGGAATWCLDGNRCSVAVLPGPCGYRLPTVREWNELVALSPEGLDVGRVAELTSPGKAKLQPGDVNTVVGSSWLSSPSVDAAREAPTRVELKAFNIGFRLAR